MCIVSIVLRKFVNLRLLNFSFRFMGNGECLYSTQFSRAKENAESVGEDAKVLCFIID